MSSFTTLDDLLYLEEVYVALLGSLMRVNAEFTYLNRILYTPIRII